MHEKKDGIILLKFSTSLPGLGTKERQFATVALDIWRLEEQSKNRKGIFQV